jgi:hypothetical protein
MGCAGIVANYRIMQEACDADDAESSSAVGRAGGGCRFGLNGGGARGRQGWQQERSAEKQSPDDAKGQGATGQQAEFEQDRRAARQGSTAGVEGQIHPGVAKAKSTGVAKASTSAARAGNSKSSRAEQRPENGAPSMAWHGQEHLAVRSGSALVIAQDGGEALYEKNARVVVPIASITKLMTAMVVLDSMPNLQAPITITDDDVDYLKGVDHACRWALSSPVKWRFCWR